MFVREKSYGMIMKIYFAYFSFRFHLPFSGFSAYIQVYAPVHALQRRKKCSRKTGKHTDNGITEWALEAEYVFRPEDP